MRRLEGKRRLAVSARRGDSVTCTSSTNMNMTMADYIIISHNLSFGVFQFASLLVIENEVYLLQSPFLQAG